MTEPKESTAFGLLTAATVLSRRDRAASSLPLLKRAFARGPDVEIARAGYWAGLHHGDASFSLRCLEFLENRSDPQTVAWVAGRRDRLSDLPPSDENLSNWLRPSIQERITPVAHRICYLLHSSLPFASTGYATRTHGLVAGLQAAGLDMVCMTRPGYPLDLASFASETLTETESDVDGIRYIHTPEPSRRHRAGPEYLSQAADRLTDLLTDLRPAGVMAASNYVTALPALVAARRLGLPFFYDVRGFWEITNASRDPAFARTRDFARQVAVEGTVAAQADHVFTLTGPMKEELIRRGVAADKITLVPNSCDPNRFSPRPRDADLASELGLPAGVPVIGYIGSFGQYEGLEDLAEACTILAAQGHDFRLLLVGSDDAADQAGVSVAGQVCGVMERAGLSHRLVMPGRVAHESVEAHYSLIDIAPFPRKPQRVTDLVSPLKPLEALAMGMAVVVSSVRGLGEMVRDGETGLVFDRGDVPDLARALATLIGEPETRARLGVAGRRWVESERNWKKTAAGMARVINTVTAV